ncbi:MAG: ATP synthase F0 subunit B [Anaerolineae bacterium]|nr:MAG: ATP synthase F0 subunit B [Anaerolineae bacterium]
MEGLGINLGYVLVQIFNFAIMFVVLKEWAYKPILNMLEERRATIAQGLEDARVAAEARANAEQEAQKILAEAQAKAAETVRAASERADEAAKEIKAAAEAEAAQIIERARADAEAEKERLLAELRPQVAALAVSAAQKLVGEALDEKRQRALLDEFFSGVKSGKVVVVEETFAGQQVEVVSALPLSDEEKAAIRKDLGAEEVTFSVDPRILGGLVVKAGDRVLDASVAARLEGLRASIA